MDQFSRSIVLLVQQVFDVSVVPLKRNVLGIAVDLWQNGNLYRVRSEMVWDEVSAFGVDVAVDAKLMVKL